MNAAETYGDADFLIAGHATAVLAHFFLGDPIKTREHTDHLLSLYGEDRHGHLLGILNQDPKTISLVYSALSTRMLGYPEQAVEMTHAVHDHARRRRHPFDLGWVLCVGAWVFDHLDEPDDMLKRIEEADRVGRENSLPFVTECLVPAWSGVALIRKDQTVDGTALLG
jgi:hypothetical protein